MNCSASFWLVRRPRLEESRSTLVCSDLEAWCLWQLLCSQVLKFDERSCGVEVMAEGVVRQEEQRQSTLGRVLMAGSSPLERQLMEVLPSRARFSAFLCNSFDLNDCISDSLLLFLQ